VVPFAVVVKEGMVQLCVDSTDKNRTYCAAAIEVSNRMSLISSSMDVRDGCDDDCGGFEG
jgi:hypothetical protein